MQAQGVVRRWRRRLLAFVLLAAGVALPSVASAQPQGGIDVVQVDGLLDPSNAALLRDAIADAEDVNSTVLVVQLNATGAVDTDVDALVDVIADADVPVGVWIGPTRGNARGASALVGLAAPTVAIAPGVGVGPVHPIRFDDPGEFSRAEALERVETVQRRNGRAGAEAVTDRRLPAEEAEELGVVDAIRPTVGDFIVGLDGERVTLDGREVVLDTAEFTGEGADRRRRPNQEVRFHKLDLGPQLAHTLNAPWVAYFLFVAGLSLIVFEFFTAGIGIAGFVGAVALAGGCFGFSHLPVQPWALGLLMLGLFGLAIDVQAGGLGAWTFIGSSALVAGSLYLYGGSSRLDPAWWIVALVCAGTVLFMLSGMTAMVRSRFSTPTIGREELIGEMGVAEVDVAPDGVVRLRDASWRARTNRATPIRAGDSVRVVSVEGVVLEVEPEAGGARDYRDRARRR